MTKQKVGSQDEFFDYHKQQNHEIIYRGLGVDLDWYCKECNWWC